MSASSEMPAQIGASQLVPGAVVAERKVALDQASFDAFAALTGDAHPIHYDVDYARSRNLRAPIAHGLLLTAITALGATPLSAQLGSSMVAMLGTQARFIAPVFVGEIVTVTFRVAGIEAKANNRSIVDLDVDIAGENGNACAQVRHRFMLLTNLTEEAS